MRLNLNDIRYIINESYNRLMLTEISNNAIETLFKKYLPQYSAIMDKTLTELDTLDVVDLGKNSGVSENYSGIMILGALETTEGELKSAPNMKLKDYLRLKLMKTFEINRGRGPIKYLRGIIRISFDKNEGINLFSLNGTNKPLLTKFRQIVDYICVHGLEFNEDLNGLSLEELNATVGSQMRIDAYKKWLDNKDKGQKENVFGDYTVISIDSYENASKYSQYTSWCVTQGNHHYNSYTSDNSQFYFCLKNGFENVKRVKGEGCPLDEYGLSMVSVLIRPNNSVKHITTRWNHDNNGEDNSKLKTLEQVENVLGIPQSAFIYKGIPEINELDFNELLKQGIDISSLVKKEETKGSLVKVSYGNKYNVMKGNVLLMDEWYVSARFLDDNLISLSKYDTNRGTVFNFCDERGQIFPKNMGFPIISVYDKERDIFKISGTHGVNLIKRGGDSVILPHDVSNVSPIKNGYAIIETFGKNTNIMTEDFKVLWDEPIKYRTAYMVKVREQSYKEMREGMLIVMDDKWKENYIDINTKELISEEWFDSCQTFVNGFGKVVKDKKQNLIRHDGTFISSTWYDSVNLLPHKYIAIDKGDSKKIILDMRGNVIKQFECDYIFDYNGKYGVAKDGIDVVVFTNDGNEVCRIEGIVGLIFNDIFLILKPECILLAKTGKVISDNIVLMNEVDGEPINGKIVLHDYSNQVYWVISTDRDKYKVFKDTETENLKKYLRTDA